MNNFIKNHLEILKKNHFENPDIELRALLNKTSKYNKKVILSNFNINQINFDLFELAFRRRINNEPLAKIFNEKNFWKYSFFVNEKVLDPRPETEIIIEAVEKYFQEKEQKLKIIDLGTGSGCLAISLAKEYINSRIIATDISKDALDVAERNSFKLNCNKQISFVCCDWIDTIEIFDVIVTNPPYLTKEEYKNTNKDIKLYEPKIALLGGEDGLFYFRKLAYIMPKIVDYNSFCFIELGQNQKNECIDIFEEFGMQCIDIVADYQNIDRVLILKKQKISNKY